MFAAAEELRFEYAAKLRDEIKELRRELHGAARRLPAPPSTGVGDHGMCRNIKQLHNFDPPATDDEVHAAALQYVRKISGTTKPSKANEAVFERAVERSPTSRATCSTSSSRRRRRATARSRRRRRAAGRAAKRFGTAAA